MLSQFKYESSAIDAKMIIHSHRLHAKLLLDVILPLLQRPSARNAIVNEAANDEGGRDVNGVLARILDVPLQIVRHGIAAIRVAGVALELK